VGVDVESHPWFGEGGVKTLECREGWELASPDGGVLEGYYHRRGG